MPARRSTQTTRPQTSQQANEAEVARTRVTKPMIDYSVLEVEDTGKVSHTRGSVLDGTPFVQWVQDSYDEKEGKAITVPNTAVKQTLSLIQLAADRLGKGVTKVTEDVPGRVGFTRVKFEAKDRRAYKGRTPKS